MKKIENQSLSLIQLKLFSLSGERGIRTPVRFDPEMVFETTAFNHSAISPIKQTLRYSTQIFAQLIGNFGKNTIFVDLVMINRFIYSVTLLILPTLKMSIKPNFWIPSYCTFFLYDVGET